MAPEAWFWAHDARPDQLDSLATPGLRLVRLAHYGSERYAALFHSGAAAGYRIGLDAFTASACTDAVALTVDSRSAFSVVTDPLATTAVHVDLDETDARTMVGEIMDVATYTLRGARRYAVVLNEGTSPSWLLPNMTMPDLHDEVRKLDATVVRLRAHAGESRFTAVAARAKSIWYAGLTADEVAARLERQRAYPIDLDAVATADGVRFTVVMQT